MMTVLDLFSGIGGFSLGLERAGMKTIAFCETNIYCRAVLKKHWPDIPIHDDVRTLSIPRGFADVICGGFPCQDISLAGNGAGLAGARSGLWREFRRIIDEGRPSWALIENVSALRSRGLEVVLRQLAEIGYDAEWHCIPAAAVGAPHRRDRVWIVAYPQQQQLWEQPGRRCGASWASEAQPAEHGEARNVANTNCDGRRREQQEQQEQQEWRQTERDSDPAGNGSQGAAGPPGVGDVHRPRLALWQREPGHDGAQLSSAVGASWWATEPDVGRVAHGVPRRVDRLRALGNAVVLQIPEIIGRAILESTNR